MHEDVQLVLEVAKEKMEKTVKYLDGELLKLRAGRANPHLLDGIHVDYYGVNTPLNQVSNISTTDARTILIQPWEKSMIGPIEKAILQANIGITPANNGEVIRLVVPQLTEERRKELVKQVKHECETARVGIRTARREAMEELKKLQKEHVPEDEIKKGETELEKITDQHIKRIDDIFAKKEQEILTV
ncbi:MAG TPA: ribosome recycling factor [Bacteroidales bacterium]|nr:ribosome recycling factor [Bacteroidales bacterium]